MPTPTIPERGEELSRYIESVWGAHSRWSELSGGFVIDHTIFVKEAAQVVAAFSARRAREKAIEECLKFLSDQGLNNYRWDSEGRDMKQLFEELELLKSQPQ